jgi:hypothetical protein
MKLLDCICGKPAEVVNASTEGDPLIMVCCAGTPSKTCSVKSGFFMRETKAAAEEAWNTYIRALKAGKGKEKALKAAMRVTSVSVFKQRESKRAASCGENVWM